MRGVRGRVLCATLVEVEVVVAKCSQSLRWDWLGCGGRGVMAGLDVGRRVVFLELGLVILVCGLLRCESCHLTYCLDYLSRGHDKDYTV